MKMQHQDLLQRHLTPILTLTCLQLGLVPKILILALPIEGTGIDLQRRLPTPTVVILCKILKASNACAIVVSIIVCYMCIFDIWIVFSLLLSFYSDWVSNKYFVEN